MHFFSSFAISTLTKWLSFFFFPNNLGLLIRFFDKLYCGVEKRPFDDIDAIHAAETKKLPEIPSNGQRFVSRVGTLEHRTAIHPLHMKRFLYYI